MIVSEVGETLEAAPRNPPPVLPWPKSPERADSAASPAITPAAVVAAERRNPESPPPCGGTGDADGEDTVEIWGPGADDAVAGVAGPPLDCGAPLDRPAGAPLCLTSAP